MKRRSRLSLLRNRVLADLRVVVERDPSVRGLPEAVLAPYLPALWLHRLAHPLYLRGHRSTARVMTLVGRMLSGGCDIHPGARIGSGLFIDHACAVVIGEDAVLGSDVTLYHQVTLGAVGWWRDRTRPPGERRHPTLGDGVVVGAGASVLGPVAVGDGAFIGAHALVTSEVPAGGRVLAAGGVLPRQSSAPPRRERPHGAALDREPT
ncbi:serine O-acetyltransferase [Streptomyces sp. NPDC059740]|uniref:serine O-acetyltransferase n=1 Tax=Streptomyces sp. NPDC059740 TaxID=3346926 RepID=UPI0036630F70